MAARTLGLRRTSRTYFANINGAAYMIFAKAAPSRLVSVASDIPQMCSMQEHQTTEWGSQSENETVRNSSGITRIFGQKGDIFQIQRTTSSMCPRIQVDRRRHEVLMEGPANEN
jgi:hypothetical protein